MLDKRGVVEFMMNAVYELLIGAILGLGFFMFVNHVVDHTALDKEFLARDIGLLTHMAEYSPYPYYLEFNPEEINLSKYIFNWTGSEIHVAYYHKDGYPKIHEFLRNKNTFSDNVSFNGSKVMYFVNTNDKFSIQKVKPKMNIGITCGDVKNEYDKVFLDPAHGEEKDLGFNKWINGNNYNESILMCHLANQITPLTNRKLFSSRNLDDNTINCNSWRHLDNEISLDLSKSNLYLGFSVGNYSTTRNIIKAYVKYNKNFSDAKNIACKILNSLSKLDADIIIIPEDSNEHFPYSDYSASIYIQFGSFDSTETLNMLKYNLTFIASQIQGVING
jgi:hypothetical protein